MVTLPGRKQLAILMHDFCNDFLKPGGAYPGAGTQPGNDVFIAKNVKLLEAARKAGINVFHSGHYLRKDYMDVAMDGPSQRVGAMQAGSWGADFIDELKPIEGEWHIRKGGGMSAFTGTPLAKWLRRLGVTTLIVTGSGTSVGVASTVYAIRENDFAGIVVSDGCNGVGTPQYDAAILNMSMFNQMTTVDELIEALGQLKD